MKRKYQVDPLQFIDLKALMGDTADNIPGVPKVGEKTATELMVRFGSVRPRQTIPPGERGRTRSRSGGILADAICRSRQQLCAASPGPSAA